MQGLECRAAGTLGEVVFQSVYGLECWKSDWKNEMKIVLEVLDAFSATGFQSVLNEIGDATDWNSWRTVGSGMASFAGDYVFQSVWGIILRETDWNAWREVKLGEAGIGVSGNLSYLLNLQKNGCIMLNESMIKNLES